MRRPASRIRDFAAEAHMTMSGIPDGSDSA